MEESNPSSSMEASIIRYYSYYYYPDDIISIISHPEKSKFQIHHLASSITNITIPSSVTIIGDDDFLGCSSLTQKSIPNSVTNKGEVIFINRNAVKKSPESVIKSVSLPDGEKAVSIACCEDSVVALSSNGRVFLSDVQKKSAVLNFSTVSELSDQEIVWVSGTRDHFLAVSREGRVFGRGSNSHGRLGLGQQTSKVSSFTEILSLKNYEIKAAYAGGHHSLFETREGKTLSCGFNCFSQLLLSSDKKENVYSPTETTINESASFCIAGCFSSIVFIGGDPPPNTPNK